MAFRVGQKVVCVKRTVGGPPPDTLLVIGSVYTIAAIREHPSGLGIDLVELPATANPCFRPIWDAPYYWAELFRPAVERKTDISIFTKMLTSNKRELEIAKD